MLRNPPITGFVYAVPRCTGLTGQGTALGVPSLPSFIFTAFAAHVSEAVTRIYRRTPPVLRSIPPICDTERGNGAIQPFRQTSRSSDHDVPGRIPSTTYIHQLRPRLGGHHPPLGLFPPPPAMYMLIPLRRASSTSWTRSTATAAYSV